MTKEEAKQALYSLSDGTLASLTGLKYYSDIEEFLADMISSIDYIDVSACQTWQEVWRTLE